MLSEGTGKVRLDSQTVTNIYNESEKEKNVIATYGCKDENTNLSQMYIIKFQIKRKTSIDLMIVDVWF